MASLTGLFPPCPPRRPDAAARPRFTLLTLAVCFCATTASPALPDFLQEALGKFNPAVPPGWAYTQTTERDKLTTTERFDPVQPPAEQWTLLRYNGQAPSAPELEKYGRFKAANPTSAAQAAFQKGDIDPGSIVLIREDSERAVFSCAFRAESADSDKMLGHLHLQLVVNKRQPHVEKFQLALREPYSPVLGVKMNGLIVEMIFSAPTSDRPSLPAVSTSHFVGRILFFFGTEENLRLTYFDFTRRN